jgi:hypothetical protein
MSVVPQFGFSLRDLFLLTYKDYFVPHVAERPTPYATWSAMGVYVPDGQLVEPETGIPVQPLPRFIYLESLTPSQYHYIYRQAVLETFRSLRLGQTVPPYNENAHLAVLCLDIDDGNVPLCEMEHYGRLIQNTARVHLGLSTSFVLCGRITTSGKKKYHLFFPGIVMSDMRIWLVIRSLINPFSVGSKKKVDDAPTWARHLRLHASQRTIEDYSGVYQALLAYDDKYEPIQDLDIANGMTSVRVTESVLTAWMTNPAVRVQTSVASEKLKTDVFGNHIDDAAIVTDNEHERAEVVLTDRAKGQWALVDVKRKCTECRDVFKCRVLYRIYENVVYRWCLCPECKKLTSLPVRAYSPSGIQIAKYMDMSLLHQLSVLRLSHLYDMPLECVCLNGIYVNEAQTIKRVGNTEHLTVSQLGSKMGSTRVWPTKTIKLTAADCGVVVGGPDPPRLSIGLAQYPFEPLSALTRTRDFITIQAPCGAGKTTTIMQHILASNKVLVVAPRVSLTLEFAVKIEKAIRDAISEAGLNKTVGYYKDVAKNAHADVEIYDVFVVTPESLHKFKFRPELLIVDELCTVVKTLYNSNTTLKTRVTTQGALLGAMATARRTFFLDKDIGFGENLFLAAALCHLEKLQWPVELGVFESGPPQFKLTHIVLADEVKRKLVVWPDNPSFIASMADKLSDGTSAIGVFCAVKKDAHTIHEYFKDDYPCLLITGSSSDEAKRDFAANPNGVLAAHSTRLFIYTSTIGVGVSVDEHRFTDVYVSLGGHMTWRDALQGEARIRKLDGQGVWDREINVYINNVSTNEYLTDRMPTIGTAVAEAQYQIASANTLRFGTANLENVQVDGAPTLAETPLGIVEAAVCAIHELEIRWQLAFMFEWAHTHTIEFREKIEAEESKEITASLKEARSQGIELRQTQDTLQDTDGPLTQVSKRRRVEEVVGRQMPDMTEQLAKSTSFMDWSKNKGSCLKVWYGVHLVLTNQAVRNEVGRLLDGNPKSLTDKQLSVIGPARLALACAAVSGSLAIFDGVSCVKPGEYVPANVTSPLDGYSTWTHDELFEWFSGIPLYDQKGAATHGAKTHLRAFTKAYEDAPGDEAKKNASRAKYAHRVLSALLGGGVAMEAPAKIIWTVRHNCQDIDAFRAVEIEEECPW